MTTAAVIVVTYTSIDHFRKQRRFKTLAGAQRFAHRYVGPHPDQGSTYAVSDDGIGKIEVRGATLADLFPDDPEPDPRERGDDDGREYADPSDELADRRRR